MKKIIIVSLTAVLLATGLLLFHYAYAAAKEDACCICEIGIDYPNSLTIPEIAWSSCCDAWLDDFPLRVPFVRNENGERVNCVAKIKRSVSNAPYNLPAICNGKKLIFMYYGHFSSGHTKMHLRQQLAAANKHGSDVYSKNPACHGLRYPEATQKWLAAQTIPGGKDFIYEANQCVGDCGASGCSTVQTYVKISHSGDVLYPPCSDYIPRKKCWLVFQEGCIMKCRSDCGLDTLECCDHVSWLGWDDYWLPKGCKKLNQCVKQKSSSNPYDSCANSGDVCLTTGSGIGKCTPTTHDTELQSYDCECLCRYK